MTRVYVVAFVIWTIGSLVLLAAARLRARRKRETGVIAPSPQGWDFR